MRTVSRPTETVPTNLRAETFFDAIATQLQRCILLPSGIRGFDGDSSTRASRQSGTRIGRSLAVDSLSRIRWQLDQ